MTTDDSTSLDPRNYRIVLVDQRNAGRSRPSAAEPCVGLSANTTPDLVADSELVVIGDAGHGGAGMTAAVVAATDRFAGAHP